VIVKPKHLISLSAVALACASLLFAQAANPMSTEVKGAYTGIKTNVTKAAEKMPEDQYAFKATPEVQSFAQRVAHIADSNLRTCAANQGRAKDSWGSRQDIQGRPRCRARRIVRLLR
jgi:hypothetical protein